MGEAAETTRRGFAAFSRGDFDASLAEMDPEVEWHVALRVPDLPPDKEAYRGVDEVRSLWESVSETWETLELELQEVLEETDELLVAKCRFFGRGSRAGIEVDRVFYYVLDLRDGKLSRVRPFETEAEAREAAGLDDG